MLARSRPHRRDLCRVICRLLAASSASWSGRRPGWPVTLGRRGHPVPAGLAKPLVGSLVHPGGAASRTSRRPPDDARIGGARGDPVGSGGDSRLTPAAPARHEVRAQSPPVWWWVPLATQPNSRWYRALDKAAGSRHPDLRGGLERRSTRPSHRGLGAASDPAGPGGTRWRPRHTGGRWGQSDPQRVVGALLPGRRNLPVATMAPRHCRLQRDLARRVGNRTTPRALLGTYAAWTTFATRSPPRCGAATLVPVTGPFESLRDEEFVVLTTFRRTGIRCVDGDDGSPSMAGGGDRLDAGRCRENSAAAAYAAGHAPGCTRRGEPSRAALVLVPPEEVDRHLIEQALAGKYGSVAVALRVEWLSSWVRHWHAPRPAWSSGSPVQRPRPRNGTDLVEP